MTIPITRYAFIPIQPTQEITVKPLLALPLSLSLLMPIHAWAAVGPSVSVDVDPVNTFLNLGDETAITLRGNYVGEGNLLGGAVDLIFDPTVVHVLNVALLAPTDIAGQAGTIDNDLGRVDTIAFASFAGVTGSFQLASVTLKAVGAGTSSLTLSDANDAIYVWANDVPPFGEAVTFIQDNVGEISVAVVPEPETWAMLLAGLGLTGIWFRRVRACA
jgi:hypothetical protein